jgi:hypothetical protein
MPLVHRTETSRTTYCQAVLFERLRWTPDEAKAWLKAHGYRYGAMRATERYLRFRQFDPVGKHQYRVKQLGNGVVMVIGFKD